MIVLPGVLKIVGTLHRIHGVVAIPEMKPRKRVPGKIRDMEDERPCRYPARHFWCCQFESPACFSAAAAATLCLRLWGWRWLCQRLHEFPELLSQRFGEARGLPVDGGLPVVAAKFPSSAALIVRVRLALAAARLRGPAPDAGAAGQARRYSWKSLWCVPLRLHVGS